MGSPRITSPKSHQLQLLGESSTDLVSQGQGRTLRSPRLSPLTNIDFSNNLKADIPFPGNRRGFKDKNSVISGDMRDWPEPINEELKEEEDAQYVRKSRFMEMRDRNEFGHGQKRYKSDDRGKKRSRLMNHRHSERFA